MLIDVNGLLDDVQKMHGYELAYVDVNGFDEFAYIPDAINRDDVVNLIKEYANENS